MAIAKLAGQARDSAVGEEELFEAIALDHRAQREVGAPNLYSGPVPKGPELFSLGMSRQIKPPLVEAPIELAEELAKRLAKALVVRDGSGRRVWVADPRAKLDS